MSCVRSVLRAWSRVENLFWVLRLKFSLHLAWASSTSLFEWPCAVEWMDVIFSICGHAQQHTHTHTQKHDKSQ